MSQKVDREVDCLGLYCPMPISHTREAMDELEDGQVLMVEADDPATEEDIPRWAKRSGHRVVDMEKDGPIFRFWIVKGG